MSNATKIAASLLLVLPAMPAFGASPSSGRCSVVPWLPGEAPTVSIRVNGQGPFAFVIDTGAEGDAWIKPELAERLHLKVVGKVPPDGPDDPEQNLRLFGGRSLEFGQLTFANPRFGEMLQMGSKAQPFDGIIGSGLFDHMQVTFDYRRRQFRATKDRLTNGAIVPFDRGMPIARLKIGQREVAAHLDTGNVAGALFVGEEVGSQLPLAGPAVAKGKARTHYGEQSLMEARLAEPVRFGETILPITSVRWPAAIGVPNLGSRGLKDMVVAIDARTKMLAISPAKDELSCSSR